MPDNKRKREEAGLEDDDYVATGIEGAAASGGGSASVKQSAKKAKTKRIVKSDPKKQTFPFMSLPPELRNKVYHHALTSEMTIYLDLKVKRLKRVVQKEQWKGPHLLGNKPGQEILRSVPLVPNILLLNKKIHDEAWTFLYSENLFAPKTITTLYNFLLTIGPKNRAVLERLKLIHWGVHGEPRGMTNAAFDLMVSCPNLRSVFINSPLANSNHGTTVAENFYREAWRFLEAVGKANGRRYAALEIVEMGDLCFQYNKSTHMSPENFEAYMEHQRELFRAEVRRLLK